MLKEALSLEWINARRVAAGAALSAIALVVSGCNVPVSDRGPAPAVETCDPDNANTLPSAANSANLVDERTGDILACHYLMDMRIPYNEPTDLYSITNETFDSAEFRKEGDFGGWMFVGVGGVNGKIQESGETVRKRVNLVRIVDADGSLQTLILDAEKVRLKPCEEGCSPSIEIIVDDTTLFKKDRNDDSSIWYSARTSSKHDARSTTVGSVSEFSGKVWDSDNKSSIYGGGPKTPGEVVSALASRIVITLPEDAIK